MLTKQWENLEKPSKEKKYSACLAPSQKVMYAHTGLQLSIQEKQGQNIKSVNKNQRGKQKQQTL